MTSHSNQLQQLTANTLVSAVPLHRVEHKSFEPRFHDLASMLSEAYNPVTLTIYMPHTKYVRRPGKHLNGES